MEILQIKHGIFEMLDCFRKFNAVLTSYLFSSKIMQRDSYNASIVLSNYLKWQMVWMLYCKIMCGEYYTEVSIIYRKFAVSIILW